MILKGLRIKKHLAFALVLTLVFFFAACSGGSSALVGKWTGEDNESTMEFLKDGTGIVESNAITWKVENDRLYITVTAYLQTQTITFGYKISGATLVLTSDSGENITLKKNK
jgi:hypothetical protein